MVPMEIDPDNPVSSPSEAPPVEVSLGYLRDDDTVHVFATFHDRVFAIKARPAKLEFTLGK